MLRSELLWEASQIFRDICLLAMRNGQNSGMDDGGGDGDGDGDGDDDDKLLLVAAVLCLDETNGGNRG